MTDMLLVLGLILFIGLVVVHEYGHFLAARRNGVDVEEFGIGFPPKVWRKKMPSGFIFSVNLLPLGGFVRLKGEHEADKEPHSFGAAALPAKIKIILAGVAMNLGVAAVIFTLLALAGLPKLFDDQFTVASDTKIIREVKNKDTVLVAELVPGSPAEKAGLKPNDQIISVNNSAVTSPEALGDLTKRWAGQEVELVVRRDQIEQTLTVLLEADASIGRGYLGVISVSGAEGLQLRRSTWSAPIVGLGLTKQIAELTYKGLGTALASLFRGEGGRASEQVAGPVGIFRILKDGTALGWQFILMIIGVLSLTLAAINVLPIPALDGGRLFVLLLFKSLKRPLSKRTEEWIHGTGFALLMLLFILITVIDVVRL